MDSSSTKRHYEFLTQNFRPVMFSLYREAAEASVDLFSVSNRDEISGNREIKGVRSHQTNLIHDDHDGQRRKQLRVTFVFYTRASNEFTRYQIILINIYLSTIACKRRETNENI